MFSRNNGTSCARVEAAKNKRLKKLRNALASIPIFEALEERRLLSVTVSGQALAGPIFTPGTSWTYLLTTADNQTATYTRTVVGPTTFQGQSATEIDGTLGKATFKDYIGTNGAGDIIIFGEDSTTTFGSDADIYSPYQLWFPFSVTQGVTYSHSYTDVDTSLAPEGGVPTVTTFEETQSGTFLDLNQSVSTPYADFVGNAYKLQTVETDTQIDVDGTPLPSSTTTITDYSVEGIGFVQMTDDNGNQYSLQSFSTDTEHLAFTKQPTDTDKATTLPAVEVSVIKKTGELDTDATGTITLSLNSITGNGKLSGTLTATIVSGVATFDNLQIDGAGTYTLTATDNAVPPVTLGTSAQFDITVPALTWTGKGDGVNWSDPKNWDADIKPQNGDSLIFPTGSPLTSNNDLVGLSITYIDIQGSGYTLQGNSIKLTKSLTSEAGSNTYNIDTQLVGSPEIDDQTGDLTIKSVLSGGGLTIGGSGTVNFNKANTYTGPTTLKAGITIGNAVLTGAFGTAALTIGAGAKPVTIANTSSGSVTISNNVTFEDGATLAIDPTVTFDAQVKLQGAAFLDPIGVDDEADFDNITGTGSITLTGQGLFRITGDVSASVKIFVDSGDLYLGANLLGDVSTNQIILTGGRVTMLPELKGAGGIEVQTGTLFTDRPNEDGGTPNYSGNITLFDGGTIKLTDNLDTYGLGSGHLNLYGGLLQNASTGDIQIDNDTTIDSATLTISGGKFLGFYSDKLNAAGGSTFTAAGTVSFVKAITMAGSLSSITRGSSDSVQFFGGIKGTGDLFADGAGFTLIQGTVTAGQSVIGEGKLANGTGRTVIGAKLAGTGTQLYVQDGGVVELIGGNSVTTAVSGTGGIAVTGGVLSTDTYAAAAGAFGYSGEIQLQIGGTIKIYDTADDGGFGTGNLTIFGGVVQNSAGKPVAIGNNIEIVQNAHAVFHAEGNLTLNGASIKMDEKAALEGTGVVDITNAVTLDVSGEILTPLKGDLIFLNGGVTGTGQLATDGPGEITIFKSVGKDITLDALGDSVGSTGFLVLACNLMGVDGQVTVWKGAIVSLQGTDGSFLGTSGAGGIVVKDGGTLTSDEITGHGGSANYKGNLTLEAGGTIKVYDIVDDKAFGTGTITVNGGLIQNAIPAELVVIANKLNFTGGKANLTGGDGGLTFNSDTVKTADQTTLYVSGEVNFNANVEITDALGAYATTTTSKLFFVGGLKGTGTVFFDGPGIEAVLVSVADTVQLISHGEISDGTGGLIISAKLLSTADDQVKIDLGGRVSLAPDSESFAGVSGTGGIQVINGTLVSRELAGVGGIPNYSGNITVEENGTIKYYDAIDGAGFGTGLIHMKGGLLQNSSGGDAFLNNSFMFEGASTISGGQSFVLNGNSVTFNGSDILFTGEVAFQNAVTLTATGANIATSDPQDAVFFRGGLKGEGTLGADGPGTTIMQGTVVDGVNLVARGKNNGVDGRLVLAGKLDGSGDQVTTDPSGRVQILGAGNSLGALSGTGGISVDQGYLFSSLVDDGGVTGYSGTITVDNGGVIKVYDTKDGNGLGTATIVIKNGLIQNLTGGIATINNDISVDGILDLSSHDDRLKLAGGVNIVGTGSIRIVGFVALTGALVGTGSLVLDSGELAVAGSNPVYIGHVYLYSGSILVTQNYALGQGNLDVDADAQDTDYLIAVASIGDPILNNHLTIQSGTLVLNGEFTFPNGVTINEGAKLEIQGAASIVIISGALSGPGGVVIDAGTFSATGDTSGFTGTISDQANKDIPTLTVTDAGGVANDSPFPATYTLTGTSGTPSDNLDGVTPTLTYYVGPKATGVGTSTAPSAAGTYTVIATFAGSVNYAAVTSASVTFVITSEQQVKTTPTLTTSDAGGVYNGTLFAAGYTLTGASGVPMTSLDGVSPTFLYYVGSTSSGIGSSSAPEKVGTYTVVASFAGSDNYNPVTSAPVTFSITQATPTLTVSDAGGVANGSPFPATYMLTGISGSPSAALEGVTPTLAYYLGSTATGAPTATAPSAAGTYTVVASFAGSQDYKAMISTAVTFVISQGQPANVPPTIAAPVSVTLTQDSSLVFSTANGNAIVVADADANGKAEQLTLTATHGTIKLKSTAGLQVISGANNSSTVTIKGTLADLNKALDGLAFTPAAGYGGSASLNVSVDDFGANGTASKSVAITVNPKSAAKPVVTLTLHPAAAVRGQRVGMVFKFTEPGRRPPGERITYHVSYGDGTSVTFVGSLNQFRSHVYRTTGTFTIAVTATNKAGQTSDVLSRQIQIVAAAIETSPFNSHSTALFVGGTTGSDVFDFRKIDTHTIAVKINGIPAGTFASHGPIIIKGQGGHDVIKKDKDIGRIYFG